MIESFHFLRPELLSVIPMLLALWWWARRLAAASEVSAQFAPHLAEALTIGESGRRLVKPVDSITLILFLSAIALAGPSWRQLPAPWFSEEAPLVIAIEVSDSMRSNDVLPNRLERTRIKVLELLKQRTGARTALIAYSGSAHLVVPLTKDADVIRLFLEGLDPLMMPNQGSDLSQVLALSRSLFPEDEQIGTLMIVTDNLAPSDAELFGAHQAIIGAPPIVLYIAGTPTGGVALMPDGTMARDSTGGMIDTRVDLERIEGITNQLDIPLVELGSDVSDIRRLVRVIRSQSTAAEDPDSLWIDEAWWLLWPIGLLMLLHFRQGWTSS